MNLRLNRLAAAAAIGGLVALSGGAIASADRDGRGHDGDDHAVGVVNAQAAEARVHVENDMIRVNGATVTATSSSGFVATVATSSPVFTFKVQTDSATKFEFKGKGRGTIADVTVGDSINFRGVILSGTTTPSLTVKAMRVEDKTRHPAAISTASTAAAAEAQIDVLSRLIARLQAILDQLRLAFQIH